MGAESFLAGLKVLVIGPVGGAAAFAGEALAQFGADVVTGRARAGGVPDHADADIAICDRVAAPADGLPADRPRYLAVVSEMGLPTWVTISAFGLSGPLADDFASDWTLSASSGLMDLVRDAGGMPRALPGDQALRAAGQAAALAALYGLDRFYADGVRSHQDVSAHEALVSTVAVLALAKDLLSIPDGPVAARVGGPFGAYACTDGFVHLGAIEAHQWQGVLRAVGALDLGFPIDTPDQRLAHATELRALVEDWTSVRSKAECEAAFQADGVPACAINDVAEATSTTHFRERHPEDDRDSEHRQVRALLSSNCQHPVGRPSMPDRETRGLRSLRVAECSHVIAVSVAGSILGAMGARVVKQEQDGRLDVYRRYGPYITGHVDLEWSGYFAVSNHSKTSHVFESTEELSASIRESDVVLENWGSRRAHRLGVDAETVCRAFPEKLALSCSGFGHRGPFAGYGVYAYSVNAHAGLTQAMSRGPADFPSLDRLPWIDFCSAYVIATAVSAWSVGRQLAARAGRTSTGVSVDLSMVDVMLSRLVGSSARSTLRAEPVDWNGESVLLDAGAPHLVRCVDGELAVTVPEPVGSVDLGPSSAATVSTATRQLLEHGALVSEVLPPHAVARSAHLREREFLTPVEHPLWGRRRLVGLPWREAGEAAIPIGAPPIIGDAASSAESRH